MRTSRGAVYDGKRRTKTTVVEDSCEKIKTGTWKMHRFYTRQGQ
jgi:hypothetical protein